MDSVKHFIYSSANSIGFWNLIEKKFTRITKMSLLLLEIIIKCKVRAFENGRHLRFNLWPFRKSNTVFPIYLFIYYLDLHNRSRKVAWCTFVIFASGLCLKKSRTSSVRAPYCTCTNWDSSTLVRFKKRYWKIFEY